MKRVLLAAVCAAAIAAPVRSAHAQVATFCTNCSEEFSTLIGLAKQADQYVVQGQQYATQLRQWANMLQNTIALPQEVWAQVQSQIMQVESLGQAASVLTGKSGSLLTRLNSASGYANQFANLGGIGNQFQYWQNDIGNNLTTFGKTLGLQNQQAQNNAAIQAAIQAHSQTAAGQMQAIQASTEMLANNGTTLTNIQQTLLATAQMQANQDAVNADRQASEDAALLQYTQNPGTSLTGYRTW